MASKAGHQSRRPSGNYRPGERRKQAILDAAIQLWSEGGSRGTGLIAVARKAGVTHSGLLHHFGSKSNLLVEVIAERQRRAAEENERVFGSGLDVVRNLPRVADTSESEPALAQLLHVLMAENLDAASDAHEYFVARLRKLRERTANALRQAQAAGEIRGDIDPDLKAAEIIAFVDGAHVQWLLDPDRTSLRDLLTSYSEALLRDLQVQRPTSRKTKNGVHE